MSHMIASLPQHEKPLSKIAMHLVRDYHAAEDLVQDAWLAAWKQTSGAHGQPPIELSHPRAWLRKVVSRRATNWRKSEVRRAAHEAMAAQPTTDPGPRPESLVIDEQVRQTLMEAVDALRPKYRELITLHFFDELEVAEIAKRVDLSQPTVRYRIKSALGELHARLIRAADGDSRSLGAALLGISRSEAHSTSTIALGAAERVNDFETIGGKVYGSAASGARVS